MGEKADRMKQRAYDRIPENEISPDNPYTILVSRAGYTAGSLYLYVVKTDGHKRPKSAPRKESSTVYTKRCFLGATVKSSFFPVSIECIVIRDFYNMLHRIKLHKQHITPEIMASVTHPHLREQLIEAICLAAIR
jgi:hypothetical protein